MTRYVHFSIITHREDMYYKSQLNAIHSFMLNGARVSADNEISHMPRLYRINNVASSNLPN
jgi:hypothetical protein